MTDRIHRDDFELDTFGGAGELGLESPEQAALTSNAAAARAARAQREAEPVMVATAAPREHTVDPGDIDAASALPLPPPVDDAAADAIARWSAAGGAPAPHAADCVGDARWIAARDRDRATLRDGDEWVAEYGARPATLAESDARWTNG